MNIIYRAGKENVIADALSRNPQAPAPQEGIAESEVQVAQIQGAEQEEDELEPDQNQPGEFGTLAEDQRRDRGI